MRYRLLADAVVLLHLAFVAFAMAGGLLVLWRRSGSRGPDRLPR